MANEFNWVNHLSPAESETYAELVNNGIKVYPAPITIKGGEHINMLGITRADCMNQWIGPRKFLVHLSPVSKEVHDAMYEGERTEYRREARSNRCMVTGKRGRPIRCPEGNKCAQCPYPEVAERHLPNTLSWEGLIDDEGNERPSPEDVFQQIADRDETDRILDQLYYADPELVEMVRMAADGLSRKQIAEQMNIPLITVYKRFERIARIGNQYREDNL